MSVRYLNSNRNKYWSTIKKAAIGRKFLLLFPKEKPIPSPRKQDSKVTFLKKVNIGTIEDWYRIKSSSKNNARKLARNIPILKF